MQKILAIEVFIKRKNLYEDFPNTFWNYKQRLSNSSSDSIWNLPIMGEDVMNTSIFGSKFSC